MSLGKPFSIDEKYASTMWLSHLSKRNMHEGEKKGDLTFSMCTKVTLQY